MIGIAAEAPAGAWESPCSITGSAGLARNWDGDWARVGVGNSCEVMADGLMG